MDKSDPPKDVMPMNFKPALADRDRLTVIHQVHHEHRGEEPVTARGQYSRFLETEEQPYQRREKVGSEWKQLDYQWIEQPSLVFIENRVGYGLVVNPDEGQKAEMERQVIEVRLGENGPIWEVRPKECLPLPMPVNESIIFLRSQHGIAPTSVSVFPK